MTRPRFIDDLAGMASGAMSAFAGVSEEIEQRVAARMDEAFRSMRIVRRDEFDAVLELASNARAGHEDAVRRLELLEARLASVETRLTGLQTTGHAEGPDGAPDETPSPETSVPAARPSEAAAPDAVPAHMQREGGLGAPPPREPGGPA